MTGFLFPAVACVLANWDNVLQAINMATSEVPFQLSHEPAASLGVPSTNPIDHSAKAARLQVPESGSHGATDAREAAPLPATLVRIPADQPKSP